VRVLALVHGEYFGAGTFGEVIRDRGHELVEWESSVGLPPDDDYDALIVFGGRPNPDEEREKPWLADELQLLANHLDEGTPMLGVCLGAQLLAKVSGGRAFRLDEDERGWADVELTPAARDDPLFAAWPERVRAFESHGYSLEPPPGAVELARNRHVQAYRIEGGRRVWGVQFHPEVTAAQANDFVDRRADELRDPAGFRAETAREIGRWTELGRSLCGAFLDQAYPG
jgi:GMP synthase-like glutamine amidotransferase